jgi:hypothetical protein
LQREKHELAIRLLRANSQLRLKQLYCERLEFLLHERLEKIDQLTGVIEQLRAQTQRLGLENQVLVAMIAAPPLDAAMLSPK